MQQTAATAPAPTSPSFAGLLAALAASPQRSGPAWNDEELADDVAILSYENALRAHARYRAGENEARSLTRVPDPEPALSADAVPAATAPPSVPAECAGTAATNSTFTPCEKNLKCASITIRVSEAEFAQLRTRAAEAGLTVSAYLRSCTFEAELLRAQVKEALAELRAAAPARKHPAPSTSQRSWLQRLTGIWPHGGAGRRMAQA